MSDSSTQVTTGDDELLVRASDLAKFLDTSTRTIYRLTETSSIPFYKLGTGLRFKRSEVLAALRQEVPE